VCVCGGGGGRLLLYVVKSRVGGGIDLRIGFPCVGIVRSSGACSTHQEGS
jgi:hypothetical protein